MGINKSWNSTFAFQKFREKTHQLSKIYWLQQLGVDCLRANLKDKTPQKRATDELTTSFAPKMLNLTVEETEDWLPTFMDRNRLHLLVIFSAILESYLKEASFFYLASNGHLINPTSTSEPMRLTDVGKALGSPILEKSNVAEMVRYAASLYGVTFGSRLGNWSKVYQIRCLAAHNGGMATEDFLKKMSGFGLLSSPKLDDLMGLSWDELRAFMKEGDEIASIIDVSISSHDLRIFEKEKIMRHLKMTEKLPPRREIWTFMHENYGMVIRNVDQKKMENRFF